MAHLLPNTGVNSTAKIISKTKTRKTKLSALYCAVSLALLPVTSLISMPVQAQKLASQHAFNVKAGSMAQALRNFASQAGISISFKDHMLSGIKSNGLQGSYAIETGLKKLLLNAPLSFRSSANKAFIIEKRNINTLATAQVSDNTLGNNTEGTGSYTTGNMNSATGLNLSMRETPQSVSVITAQLMQDQNLRTLTDVVNSAVGISARALDSERQIYASRGFSIDSYQIDGNSITWSPAWSAGENNTNTVIFDRVEIVRGATGLMVGAGNPSASINLVRKRADSKDFTASVNVDAGSWSNYRAMADIGLALNNSGTVRVRVVASYDQGDSFVDLASKETTIFYGVIDVDLTDNTLFSFGSSYQNNTPKGTSWGGLPIWYSDDTRTDYARSKTKSTKWSSWQSTNKSYFARLSQQFENNWQLTMDINRIENIADEKLIWIVGAPNKQTGQGMLASPSYLIGERTQDDINIKLNGGYQLFEREHSATFGYNYSNQDQHTSSDDSDVNVPIANFDLWDGDIAEPQWGNFSTPDKMNTEQQGFYGVTRLSLTDELKLIVGGRYADWQQEGNDWSGDIKFGDTAFIPYAGVLYDIHTNHTLYLSFTDIFKPQNRLDYQGKYLEPIRGNNYELGLKSDFFDGHLSTSVTLFKIEQDNLAQADTGRTVPGTTPPAQAFYAAQGTVSEGFEAEVIGKLQPNWDLSLGYTQFNAEDVEGKQVNTNQPRKLFKLFTKYNFTDQLQALSIGGGINWQSDNFTIIGWGPYAGREVNQSAYALVNLMARYEFTAQLTAQINIDNLLDKTYYSQIGFYSQLAYGKPRSVNLNLSYQF